MAQRGVTEVAQRLPRWGARRVLGDKTGPPPRFALWWGSCAYRRLAGLTEPKLAVGEGRMVGQTGIEPVDCQVDRARVGVLAHAPHFLENRLARHRLAFVLHQGSAAAPVGGERSAPRHQPAPRSESPTLRGRRSRRAGSCRRSAYTGRSRSRPAGLVRTDATTSRRWSSRTRRSRCRHTPYSDRMC